MTATLTITLTEKPTIGLRTQTDCTQATDLESAMMEAFENMIFKAVHEINKTGEPK